MALSRNNNSPEICTFINKAILIAFLDTYLDVILKNRQGVLSSVATSISRLAGKNNATEIELWIKNFKVDIENMASPGQLVNFIIKLGTFAENAESKSMMHHSTCCETLHAMRSYILSCLPEFDSLTKNQRFDKQIFYDAQAETDKLSVIPIKKLVIIELINRIIETNNQLQDLKDQCFDLMNPDEKIGTKPEHVKDIQSIREAIRTKERNLLYLGYGRHLATDEDIIRLFPKYTYPTQEEQLKDNLQPFYPIVLQKRFFLLYIKVHRDLDCMDQFEAITKLPGLTKKPSAENIIIHSTNSSNAVNNMSTTLDSDSTHPKTPTSPLSENKQLSFSRSHSRPTSPLDTNKIGTPSSTSQVINTLPQLTIHSPSQQPKALITTEMNTYQAPLTIVPIDQYLSATSTPRSNTSEKRNMGAVPLTSPLNSTELTENKIEPAVKEISPKLENVSYNSTIHSQSKGKKNKHKPFRHGQNPGHTRYPF